MASKKSSTSIAGSMRADELKWRTESDLRTLQEAEAIEKDPKRFKAAQALAKTKLLELAAMVSDTD